MTPQTYCIPPAQSHCVVTESPPHGDGGEGDTLVLASHSSHFPKGTVTDNQRAPSLSSTCHPVGNWHSVGCRDFSVSTIPALSLGTANRLRLLWSWWPGWEELESCWRGGRDQCLLTTQGW